MKTSLHMNVRLAILAAALTGAAALIYEIVATKALFYFFNQSTYSVSSVVATFLAGLAIGAFLISLKISTIQNKRDVFAGMQILIGLYALFVLPRFDLVPEVLDFIYGLTGSNSSFLLPSKVITSTLYLLIPTILIGASFPLIISIVVTRIKEVGKEVGIVYSFDLLGAVIGALIAGFVLLPHFGISATYFLGGLLSFLAAFLVLIGEKRVLMARAGAVTGFAFLGLFVFMNPFTIDTVTVLEERDGFLFEKQFEKKDVLFAKESAYGEVRIVRDPDYKNDLVLYLNRRAQCFSSISPSEQDVARSTLAGVPGEGLKTLNVGLGCGMTLSALAEDPRTEEVHVVEINPVVYEAAEYFSEYTNDVLRSEKLEGGTITEDGFRYLATTDELYDAIVVDIENPLIIHSSPLYTVEFFQEVSESLTDRGVFGLWAYQGEPQYLAIIYRSLRAAFPRVYMIRAEVRGDYYFISSQRDLDPVALGVKVDDIARQQFINAMQGTKLNTLDHPVLEYEFSVREGEQ